METVYLDEVFALNLLADYLLLLSAARLRGLTLHRGRLAAGAVLGAVYAVVCLLPGLAWLRRGGPLLCCSALMSLAAWGRDRGVWRTWLCFLALSAAYGGGVVLALRLAGSVPGRLGVVHVPLRVLILSFAGFYALLRFCFARQEQKRGRELLPVELCFNGQTVRFIALRDTGNALTDPVSGRRVLIAERRVLFPLLPPGLPEDAVEAMEQLSGSGLERRFTLVPYRAVGTERGLLLCIRPDSLSVAGEDSEALAAVAEGRFSESGEYEAVY